MSGDSSTPEASAAIDIHYEDPEKARFIQAAITPDNLQAPEGVTVEADVMGSTLRVKVSCDKGVGSLIVTVDDLLSCVQAAEEAISEVAG